MNTEIKTGCLYDGVFYPAAEDTAYGYWHENTFLDLASSSFDFASLPPTAQPCCYTKAQGLQLLAPTALPGFSFRGRFYRTTKEILRLSMVRPLIYASASSIRKSQCILCKRFLPDCVSVLGKQVCLDCLVKKLRSNSLYFEERDGNVNWTAQVVYEVFEAIQKAGRGAEIPTQCPLPCDSILCYGLHTPVTGTYPPYGHIVGVDNQCMEGSCPTHSLCFRCADRYESCPVCSHPLTYELPPTMCPCGKELCYGFAVACPQCGRVPQRRKGNVGR